MNQYLYNSLLFGSTSTSEAWQWSIYGHHLCTSVFLHGPQIVISLTFTGAEPNVIDEGEFLGREMLNAKGPLGLKPMQSLPHDLQQNAQSHKLLRDPKMLLSGDPHPGLMEPGRPAKNLCGAFGDNRTVPFEGIHVSDLNSAQQQLLLDIVERFAMYLPEKARQMPLAQVKSRLENTYFS